MPLLSLEAGVRRREFLGALGGAAAWPVVARGQQRERMRRVVFLHGLAEHDQEAQARVAAFREGLETLGWIENRNIKIEHLFAGGDIAQIQADVAELVGSAPDVIAAGGTPVVAALKQATTLFRLSSLWSRSGRAGLRRELGSARRQHHWLYFRRFSIIGKWLEMLKEIAPGVRRMTLMFNPQPLPITLFSCANLRRTQHR